MRMRRPSRILITGNMGYVGPVVTRHLRSVMPEAVLLGFDALWTFLFRDVLHIIR